MHVCLAASAYISGADSSDCCWKASPALCGQGHGLTPTPAISLYIFNTDLAKYSAEEEVVIGVIADQQSGGRVRV